MLNTFCSDLQRSMHRHILLRLIHKNDLCKAEIALLQTSMMARGGPGCATTGSKSQHGGITLNGNLDSKRQFNSILDKLGITHNIPMVSFQYIQDKGTRMTLKQG